ncbi:hypothetical protein PMAC_001950 [Pneumocystis sp. 'macacae']|nr:hypothetical protein PMAC_001950 [Pneumocystis sp. 'macacae']
MTVFLKEEIGKIKLSIPSTDTVLDPKPYTVYLLHVQLAVQFYVLKKRYSEFRILHEELLEVTGRVPPVEFPPKHYLLNVLSKPSIIEERRRKLETYVVTIQCVEDACWRLSPSWRQFLRLPVYAFEQHINLIDNSIIQCPDQPWIRMFHQTKLLLQEVKRDISRQRYSDSITTSQAVWTASMRDFSKVREILERLDQDLNDTNTGITIEERELWRRKDLLHDMKRECDFLEHIIYANKQIKHDMPLVAQSWQDHKQISLHNTSRIPETGRTRELNSIGLIHLQKDILAEQDEQLTSFLPILREQKDMAAAISDELDIQNDMLKELDESVQKTNIKLKFVKKKCEQLK